MQATVSATSSLTIGSVFSTNLTSTDYPRPNSHFLKNGLMRRMLDVMMLKPMMTNPRMTDSTISNTKL